jgi:hypothetical protein
MPSVNPFSSKTIFYAIIKVEENIMKKRTKTNYQLLFWRFLTYTWAILAATFFAFDFFKIIDCSSSLRTITVLYISILGIFTSVKEFHRWKSKKFFSKYRGEMFVIIYTILIIVFIVLDTIHPDKYIIRTEFITTYLAILGIFALSYNSKFLKNK